MLEHGKNQNIFEDCQHGFMQGKSCLTNLLETFEDITNSLDEGDAFLDVK